MKEEIEKRNRLILGKGRLRIRTSQEKEVLK